MEDSKPAQYRAWTDEGMIDVERITFTGGDTVYVTSTDDKFDGYEFQIDIKELMQYTGLNDRNNIPIYRGDLVRHVVPGSRQDVFEVLYEVPGFSIKRKADDSSFSYLNLNGSAYEVVGHIYEIVLT